MRLSSSASSALASRPGGCATPPHRSSRSSSRLGARWREREMWLLACGAWRPRWRCFPRPSGMLFGRGRGSEQDSTGTCWGACSAPWSPTPRCPMSTTTGAFSSLQTRANSSSPSSKVGWQASTLTSRSLIWQRQAQTKSSPTTPTFPSSLPQSRTCASSSLPRSLASTLPSTTRSTLSRKTTPFSLSPPHPHQELNPSRNRAALCLNASSPTRPPWASSTSTPGQIQTRSSTRTRPES